MFCDNVSKSPGNLEWNSSSKCWMALVAQQHFTTFTYRTCNYLYRSYVCAFTCYASGDISQTMKTSLVSLVEPGIPEFLEPTHHELQCKASVRGWMEIRSDLLKCYTASYAMPQGQLCLLCANHAELLCEQCGPSAFLCKQCFIVQHEAVNIFHTPQEWKVINCFKS